MDIALDLSSSQEELEKLLSNIIEASAATAEQEIIVLSEQIKRAEAGLVALEAKNAKRAGITRKKQEIRDKRELEFVEARERWRSCRSKMFTAQDKVDTSRRELMRLQNAINENQSYVNGHQELYSDDALKQRAFLIQTISGHISTDEPVKYVHNREEKYSLLSWVTSNIWLKDSMGGELPYDFGRFRVELNYNYGNGMRQVVARIYMHEGNTSLNGYPHPHIRADAQPCLGNVERMLLEHMSNQDIANTIYTTMEYLRTYNPADPYQRLSYWGITNPWEHRGCQKHLGRAALFCKDCAYEAEDEVAQCGLNPSECMLYHRNSHPGGKHGTCVLKEVLPLIPKAEEVLKKIQSLGELSDGQNNDEANS